MVIDTPDGPSLLITGPNSGPAVSSGCPQDAARPRLWPEFEDDLDRGLGDLPEPAEAGVAGQLPYRCGAGLGAERVTMAGRAERARVARVFTAGVLGPGYPCGDDAALLVSCSAAASGTAARARKGRRSRSRPPAAWSRSTSPTAAAGECRSCGPPVMRRKVSGGWVGPAWDARPAAARPQSHGAALGSQHPWLRHLRARSASQPSTRIINR